MNLFSYTYDLVRQIPIGMVSSYGAIAEALGDIRASRAVGRMMNQNPDPDNMPCFKIVYSDGCLGGFGRGIEDKIRRLNQENIRVKDGKIVDFDKIFFNDFKTGYPLKKLREKQVGLRDKVDLYDIEVEIKTVAGLDVAYPKDESQKSCGACVIMDYNTGEIISKHTVFKESRFPYIPTYLAYRELPIVEELIKELDQQVNVFMFDGHGILHPFRFGLASHGGVIFDISSIGVAKRILVGEIKNNYVYEKDEKNGYVFYSSDRVKNPVFISPGNKISLNQSVKIVKRFSKYKIPEPVRQAHLLATNVLNNS